MNPRRFFFPAVCFDRAMFDRDPNIPGLKTNPIFDGLRSDVRYLAL
jgi:hypothetical protein